MRRGLTAPALYLNIHPAPEYPSSTATCWVDYYASEGGKGTPHTVQSHQYAADRIRVSEKTS